MELVIYREAKISESTIEDFLEMFYSARMNYLARDLLEQGLDYSEIEQAVLRAIQIAGAAGLQITQHFKPVYSQKGNVIMKDCKLSELGYALVLTNANPANQNVARWQLKLVDAFLQSQQ